MKSIYFLICFFGLLISCAESEKLPKEQELVSKFIKENAGDPDSYEPISFGKIDSVMNMWFEHPNYLQALDKFSSGEISEKEYNRIRDKIQSNTPENVMYYVIEHKYRIKNGFGGKVLKSEYFKLDNTKSKILAVE